MIYLWFTYDLLMIYLWFTYVLLMIYLWFTYDLLIVLMIYLWFTYDLLILLMIYLWFTYDLLMIYLWLNSMHPAVPYGSTKLLQPIPRGHRPQLIKWTQQSVLRCKWRYKIEWNMSLPEDMCTSWPVVGRAARAPVRALLQVSTTAQGGMDLRATTINNMYRQL